MLCHNMDMDFGYVVDDGQFQFSHIFLKQTCPRILIWTSEFPVQEVMADSISRITLQPPHFTPHAALLRLLHTAEVAMCPVRSADLRDALVVSLVGSVCEVLCRSATKNT